MLEAADGAHFEGYKGGTYLMHKNTEVHVDFYGQCTDTSIVEIKDDDYTVTLHTRGCYD